ncbi:dienelactone hydrolase family protein [Streptomyces mayteni]
MLFHSVLGLHPTVGETADRLRSAGHRVFTPDLFDGRTPESVEAGVELKDEIGQDEILRRAIAAAAPHSDAGLVYAGFSLGAWLAQTIAFGDEKARGLLLLHGTGEVPDDASVDDLPTQLHVADPDAHEPHDWQTVWYLRMREAGADVEVFRYPGAGHLYTHRGTPDHDAEAAERTWRVAEDFLRGPLRGA